MISGRIGKTPLMCAWHGARVYWAYWPIFKPLAQNYIASHIFDGLFPSFFPHLYANVLAAY
jgi:hypothetical protein